MADLARFAELVSLDPGLSVVVTLRADHSPHTTVVNAGVLPHPVTGDRVVAFVAADGTTRKLAHLRIDPTIGPDDPHPEVDDERLRVLLRDIFSAAGGTHDDWATYDHRRCRRRRMTTPTPQVHDPYRSPPTPG